MQSRTPYKHAFSVGCTLTGICVSLIHRRMRILTLIPTAMCALMVSSDSIDIYRQSACNTIYGDVPDLIPHISIANNIGNLIYCSTHPLNVGIADRPLASVLTATQVSLPDTPNHPTHVAVDMIVISSTDTNVMDSESYNEVHVENAPCYGNGNTYRIQEQKQIYRLNIPSLYPLVSDIEIPRSESSPSASSTSELLRIPHSQTNNQQQPHTPPAPNNQRQPSFSSLLRVMGAWLRHRNSRRGRRISKPAVKVKKEL